MIDSDRAIHALFTSLADTDALTPAGFAALRGGIMTDVRGTTAESKRPKLPPNWFIRAFWAVHRAMFRWTGGRRGLWKATPEKWGTFRLHTVGRTSGR